MTKQGSSMTAGRIERDDTLDALKGFAIILVMLGHCIVLNHMEDGILYDAIKAVQMPLFIIVSGYLFGKQLRIKSGRDVCQKVAKRAITYLVPFLFWIFITNVTAFPATLEKIIFQLDRGLWFLVVLFVLTVVLNIAVYLRDCTKLGIWGFFMAYAVAVLLLVVQILCKNTFLGPHLTINYLPFHLLGYMAAKFIQKDFKTKQNSSVKNKILEKKTLNIFVLIGTVLFLYFIIRFDMIVAGNRWEWLIQILASLLGSSSCIWLVYQLPNGWMKKALAYVGLYTLEIYVLHFRFATVLGFADKGLSLFSLAGLGYVLAAFVVMSVCTAFCIYILKKWRITNFLLFGKVNKH